MDAIYIGWKKQVILKRNSKFPQTNTLISTNYQSWNLWLTAQESGENFYTLTPDLNLVHMNAFFSQLRLTKGQTNNRYTKRLWCLYLLVDNLPQTNGYKQMGFWIKILLYHEIASMLLSFFLQTLFIRVKGQTSY